jgi:putative oxidoreductase
MARNPGDASRAPEANAPVRAGRRPGAERLGLTLTTQGIRLAAGQDHMVGIVLTRGVNGMKEVLFGARVHDARTDAGLLVLRLFAGLALAFLHGVGKVPPRPRFVDRVAGMGFPAPELFAWLAAFAEFGGGLLLAVGLLTRPAALLLVGHFTVVVLLAHAGDPIQNRELPLFFGVTALALLLTGPGRYSVDGMIDRRS